ncbi:MAG TPA: SprT-like domain-containing protein [Gemmatimonadales bacterium]|nr:SprT-like domain-containing protein [Gemmatimonadales bacterium]
MLPRWLRPVDHHAEPHAAPRFKVSEEALLARRLELMGLRGLKGIRVTDNRTVMVSLSSRGVLRIHRGYALAPDRVLKAVVRFVAPGTSRALRRAAEHEILSFRPEDHAAGPPRRQRAGDRPRPGDAEKAQRLAQLFRTLNERHFGGTLPALPFRLSGRMHTRLGQLCIRHETGQPYEITMSRRHIDRHGWAEAAHTLLHEMVHLWQHQQGHAVDHGRTFRRKASDVGVVGSARRHVPAGRRRGRLARVD